ncbi:MAG: glycerol-3-phosphate 1-O-acyltransferase PlsY [Acidobacteria bacterium]|nr:glycerol-3-phosphate 1-O-acyltransferase PlsY [Acidobacteriota bacterium]
MDWKILLAEVSSYLLGSIPFGYLLYKASLGGDVRLTGSGNIGATNVFRGAGLRAGAATFLLDGGKGFTAVVVARLLLGDASEWVSLAAVLAIAGHVFPVFLRFKGGKGVATAFGAFLLLTPLAVGCAAGIFALVAATTRYVSLASVVAMAAFPFILLALPGHPTHLLAAAMAAAVLIIVRHGSNIHRLLCGEEPRLGGAR